MLRKWILLVPVMFVMTLAATAHGGLVAHWPMAGDAKDVVGSNHGALVGGAAFIEDAMKGVVLRVDGVSGHVLVPHGNDIAFIDRKTLSIALWVKPASLPRTTWTTVLAKNRDIHYNNAYGIWISPENQWHFRFGAASGNANQPNAPAATEQWHHVVMTHDPAATTLRGYVNGVLAYRNASAAPGTLGNTALWIGGAGGVTEFYPGLIQDLRIYDRALSDAQVQGLLEGIFPDFLKAEKPNPADGAIGVALPLLQWSKGETAALHSVYLGTNPDLTEADLKAVRQPLAMYYHLAGLEPGVTYYWRVDEIEADMQTVHTGDVWSFVAQAQTAYYPTPADGANTVSSVVELKWEAGLGALRHHVYFGENADAVAQGTGGTDKGTFKDPNYSPGVLNAATTYYWRVDEIGAGDVVKTGSVWSFTTVVPIDDFESYTDDEGSRIYETWIDGWTNNTGSTVGYTAAPFAERTLVHGGKQSMPLDYNNVDAPFYSEAELVFPTRQNWTATGTDTLVLYVRGRPANRAAPVYVALMDTSNRRSAVTHPDSTVVTTARWTEWKIPLSSFTGVNATAVKAVYIGVGDRLNPVRGGAGLIYIDDICLAMPLSVQP
jgi:hypothetical protein